MKIKPGDRVWITRYWQEGRVIEGIVESVRDSIVHCKDHDIAYFREQVFTKRKFAVNKVKRYRDDRVLHLKLQIASGIDEIEQLLRLEIK